MKYTPEQIEKRFESLPEDVKQSLSSVDTTDVLIDIGKKHNLHIDKIGEMVDETTLVMLGFTLSDSFVGNIQSRLGLSRDLAEKIVKDINDQVLMKIRESLRKISDEHKDEVIKEEDKTVVSTSTPANQVIKPKPVLEEGKDLEKEQVLKEIEQPIKTEEQKNIETEKQSQPIETPSESFANETMPKETPLTEDAGGASGEGIIVQKLTEVTKAPVQTEEIVEKEAEKPKVTDPYREPLD